MDTQHIKAACTVHGKVAYTSKSCIALSRSMYQKPTNHHVQDKQSCLQVLEHGRLQELFIHLNKTNIVGVLPEALTADVQAVLPDNTSSIAAHTAANTKHAR